MSTRPVIRDYDCVSDYIYQMILWQKNTSEFSIRQLAPLYGLSQSLVSQVASGKRKLTRDRVDAFSQLLDLTTSESTYLDRWVLEKRSPVVADQKSPKLKPIKFRKPQNNLLKDWVNVYVKDLISIPGFPQDPKALENLTDGILTYPRIKKSIEFLKINGFLLKTTKGNLVPNESLVVSSDGIPSKWIRNFHKRALDIAKKGLERFTPDEREASSIIMNLDQKDFEALQLKIRDFRSEVETFAEERSKGKTGLYQVVIHLTKIAERD